MSKLPATFLTIFVYCLATAAHADSLQSMLDLYLRQAKAISPAFTDFSAVRGRAFYVQKHPTKNGGLSCASCHMDDPRRTGRTRANKDIDPLGANAARFRDQAKVEKWFARNCDDVLGRLCTSAEKGDFIAYILSVK